MEVVWRVVLDGVVGEKVTKRQNEHEGREVRLWGAGKAELEKESRESGQWE